MILAFVKSRVRNCEDAEDLAQETLLKAIQTKPGLAPAWLTTIAKNAILDWRKKRKETPTAFPFGICERALADEQLAEREDDLATLKRADELRRVAAATLTASQCEALEFFCRGYSMKETGERMGISESAAKCLTYRARTALRAVVATGLMLTACATLPCPDGRKEIAEVRQVQTVRGKPTLMQSWREVWICPSTKGER
jgi:RNA polymerase sigma factor (sigma-70 family)